MNTYDFTTISTQGIKNVLLNNNVSLPDINQLQTEGMYRNVLITICNMHLTIGNIDEIELILEESGE